MRVVITGALGHIGSLLIRELPSHFPGLEVVMLDDLSTQRFPSLFNLPEGAVYRFVEGDILKEELEPLLRGSHVVIHLAAITNAAGSFENQQRVEEVNYQGTVRVADACAELGIPLVFPSTTSVYGTQSSHVDESCPLEELKPQSPYAASKLSAEQLLTQLSRSGKVACTLLRLGTIFGVTPGMRFHTAINKFCWQAVMGQPLTVWRTAMQQHRPYLDVRDAVRALAHVIARNDHTGQLYNVVTQNCTVAEIVELVERQVPGTKVTLVDSPIMNQLSYHVAAGRFAGLGFEFQGNLAHGIAETVALLRRSHPP